MPIIKSAKKRARQEEVRRSRNNVTKRNLRDASKALDAAIESGKKKEAQEAFVKYQSTMDTAVKKHVVHPNKADRKKSSYNQKVKDLVAPAKKTTKTAAKKS